MGLPLLENNAGNYLQLFKAPTFWAKFLGYTIPTLFLIYALYQNFLPFGYSESFVINVGTRDDIQVSEFYLEPSESLSEKKLDSDNKPYRELNGMTTAIFKPKSPGKDTYITTTIKDEGISIISPEINQSTLPVNWDYTWEFSSTTFKDLINNGGYFFDNEFYLNGASQLEFASSSNLFEKGPFTIQAQWKPLDNGSDFQQIIGHFNWELLQEKNKVRFMIGRVDGKDGPFYSIEYPIIKPEIFFRESHNAVATYHPDPENGNGYISLYVDGKFAGRTYFKKSTIWEDYNGNKNITIGKSSHGSGKYYKGFITYIRIVSKALNDESNAIEFITSKNEKIALPIVSKVPKKFTSIELHAEAK